MQKLQNLSVEEISMVPQGANRRRLMLYKSADGKPNMSMQEDLQKAIMGADVNTMKKVSDFLDKCVGKEDSDGAMKRAAAQGIGRIAAAIKGKFGSKEMHGLIDAAGFELTPDGVGEGEQGGAGAMSVGEAMSHGEMDKGFQAVPEEMMKKAKAAGKKAEEEELAKLGYAKYPEKQPAMKTKDGEAADKGDKVDKAATVAQLDAETQKKLDAVFKAHDGLVKQNDELKAEVAALTQVNKQRELVQKAASFQHLGLPQETVMATLADAQKAGPEAYDRIVKAYEALSEQNRVAKSFGGDLFREIGSNLPGNSGAGSESGWAKIEKAAAGFVQKSGTNMSAADGVAKFLETAEGQRLYAEHQASRKDGI